MVETVDSVDHADLLSSSWGATHERPLSVLIQVNTSGEKQKNGALPSELLGLFQHVQSHCTNLQVKGLMCIGMQYCDETKHPNPDFLKLAECRSIICNTFNLPVEDFELSMGMSSDFEEAVSLGSTNVRIGTTIFAPFMSSVVSISNTELPKDENGKPLKPCCACPDTRLARDQCIIIYGEDNCLDYIEAHKECLRKLGFNI
ncbi:putative Proline synthetase co-transcribed bacterial protein [Fasciola gigantica]|uniref:Putative Proline synthetase co-transcribed bacterial protein n=1 Tax=Fasciola gigantica TaxID=46835 RepID=A0A504YSR4_FASGI|nr:putative Proline synthetase co-transcribed bacterial protein [Fasciola gigantica]